MEIPNSWSFKNKGVAEGFDNHVREQLPFYDVASFIAAHYLRANVPPGGLVYDIGCSTGNMEIKCQDLIKDRNLAWIGLDNSQDILKEYKGKLSPIQYDAQTFDYERFDIALCFLSMMFIRPMERRELLLELLEKMKPGGAIILFDKFQSQSSIEEKLILHLKIDSGIEATQILQKEHSLIGVQFPMDHEELFQFHDEMIFKVGNFEGYVLKKGKNF